MSCIYVHGRGGASDSGETQLIVESHSKVVEYRSLGWYLGLSHHCLSFRGFQIQPNLEWLSLSRIAYPNFKRQITMRTEKEISSNILTHTFLCLLFVSLTMNFDCNAINQIQQHVPDTPLPVRMTTSWTRTSWTWSHWTTLFTCPAARDWRTAPLSWVLDRAALQLGE